MEKYYRALFFILGTLCLMGAALYNAYPLVTSDTGTYINSAYTFEVARDRPFAYSIFIFLTSLKYSLWLVVIAQSMLVYYLINRVIIHIVGQDFVQKGGAVLCTGVLVAFSSVSWFTGQIMPDIFTAIGVLATFLLFHESGKRQLFNSLILWLSIFVHTSHLLIFLGISFILVALDFIRDKKIQKTTWAFLIICATSWTFVSGLHGVISGQFKVNQSFHVFMTGRLIETGTLQRYLGKNCPDESIPLCAYQNELPDRAIDFIWDGNSALYKTNGWEDEDGAYSKMVRQILTTPKYLFQFLGSSFFSSLSQLIQTDVGDGLVPNIEESNPYWKVQQYYPYELPSYLTNRQNTSNLHYKNANTRYRWIAFISFLGLVYIFFFSPYANQISREEKFFVLICLLTIIVNAFVTATFGNVLARLQSRVIWLLPFSTGLIYLNWFLKYRGKLK